MGDRITAPLSTRDMLPTEFGDRYALDRLLGRGGMGSVYLARDLRLDRLVALKVLSPEFAVQPDLRERFLRETRIAAGLFHPNIVPVFAVEDRGSLLAFAMGYVEGESLDARVRRTGPLGARDVVNLLQDVGYGLAYAHGRGVVHRDIKPENIMLERATGRALVMDFGIARTITAAPGAVAGLTRVGEVVGTPEFMSPEQAAGDHVDGRSDLYSLGLVAWFAVTGRLAIAGDNTQKTLVKQLTEAVPPVASVCDHLPAPLAAAIDHLLHKDPEQRVPRAEALIEAIDLAQLAPPVVPLAVRLFQQEGASYIVNALAVLLFAWLAYARTSVGADLDRVAVVSAATALELVLFMTIVRRARTLRRQGFDHAALHRGLRAIVAEQDDARAQALAVAGVEQRRRLRHFLIPFVAVVGAYNLHGGLSKRVTSASGVYQISRVGAVLAVTGICCLLVAVMLIAFDPYRRSVVQRVATALWAGRIGAWLMGSAQSTSQSHAGQIRPVARASARAWWTYRPARSDRLRAVESRLDRLERSLAERSTAAP